MKTDAKPKTINAEELDRLFDEGSDEIDQYLDWDSARRPGLEAKRVNVDFPQWMVAKLDREAKRRGVTRQALIKMWISDRLDAAA
jgi:hypothetical protein